MNRETRTLRTAVTLAAALALLSLGSTAHAAESLRQTPVDTRGMGPVILDVLSVPGVDTALTVDERTAEDFARAELKEPADRPVAQRILVVRTFEGGPQLFWRLKLVGSWNVAYVFANGECEGTTVIEDEREQRAPVVAGSEPVAITIE